MHCEDRGNWRLTSCPRRFAGAEMNDLAMLAKLMEKGLPPVAGGTLDQSHWFLEFCSQLWGEHGRIKAELMAPTE